MTRSVTVRGPLLLLFLASLAFAAVVDRLALIVGKTAFTQSEVEDEVRLNELETGKPLDLSAARRKEAADRMVDQQLLRDEIEATAFQAPTVQSDRLLASFCQEHLGSLAQCRTAFPRYGVTETAVRQHLVWEVTALNFTDQRFAPITTDGQATDGDSTGREMDAWLKQRRAATRIVLKQEAFQ